MVSSVKPEVNIFADMTSVRAFLPISGSLDNYRSILEKGEIVRTMLNSLYYVTIMIGLNHEDLEKALKILKSHGKRTVMQQQVLFTGGTPQPLAATVPIPVRCGGVVLFVLDVDRYERY